MKKKFFDIASAVVITFVATCFLAVAFLRPEWLLSVWIVAPLVAIVFFVGGMLLQRRLDRKCFKQVCKKLRNKQSHLESSNAEFAKLIEDLNHQVTILTTERNTLKEALDKRTSDKRGQDILSTLERIDSDHVTVPPMPLPPENDKNKDLDIQDVISELSGE